MKTLSEDAAAQAAAMCEMRERARAEDDLKLNEVLTKDPPIPVHVPSDPKADRTDYARWRGIHRDLVRDHAHAGWTGLACDRCGTELVYPSGAQLLSYPPQKQVVCIGCGAGGYRTC